MLVMSLPNSHGPTTESGCCMLKYLEEEEKQVRTNQGFNLIASVIY